jgi:hypothetical protein
MYRGHVADRPRRPQAVRQRRLAARNWGSPCGRPDDMVAGRFAGPARTKVAQERITGDAEFGTFETCRPVPPMSVYRETESDRRAVKVVFMTLSRLSALDAPDHTGAIF